MNEIPEGDWMNLRTLKTRALNEACSRILDSVQQFLQNMAGVKDGWEKLTKNLKAEIDEEKIESFRGTISFPFKPGETIAVKIIDVRGIESLRVMKVA